MSDWLTWFADPVRFSDNLRRELGGKGLGLREMTAAGLPTPTGFTLHASLGRDFFANDRRWPDAAKQELTAALERMERELNAKFGSRNQPLAVAVRSGAAVSMPGMMETVLECGRTADGFDDAVTEIIKAIESVFDSWHSAAADQYRQRKGIDAKMGTAVTVQRMFPAEFAGVLFSRDPLNLAGETMIIEMVTGGGEQLVSGDVTPQRVAIPRSGDIEIDESQRSSLPINVFERLREYALQIERLIDSAADIEWAVADGEIALLQMRPVRQSDQMGDLPRDNGFASLRDCVASEIERLRGLAGDDQVNEKIWVAHNLQESVELPTEMTWSVLNECMSSGGSLGRLYRAFGFRPPPAEESHTFMQRVFGRIYADADQLAAFFWRGLPLGYDPELIAKDADAIDGPPTRFRPELAAGDFLWNLPANLWAMMRLHRRVSRCIRDGVTSPWIRELVAQVNFGSAVAEREKIDLAALSDDELVAELSNRLALVKKSLWQSLAPGFLGGMVLARLQDRMRLLFYAGEADSWLTGLLAGLEPTGPQRESALSQVAAGQMSDREFLAEFGCHGAEELELANPRWSEDQDAFRFAVDQIRHAPLTPDERLRRAAAQRSNDERRLYDLLGEVGGRTLRDEIFRMIVVVQQLLPFREAGKHEWLKTYALLRQAICIWGDRRELGDEVFHLSIGELLSNDQNGVRQIDLRKTVREQYRRVDVPRVVAFSELDALKELANLRAEAKVDSEQRAWQGTPLSPGRATGVALVMEEITDRSPPAEPFVLVCPSTNPSWTPLMASAAALVVERGGLLSHGALIAREFGLPAVRLDSACRQLRTGSTITVDGAQGTVASAVH